MKFSKVLKIIEQNGFALFRHGATNHRRYRRKDDNGEVFYVDMSPHKWSDDVPKGTLGSIIRTSGLSKKLFR